MYYPYYCILLYFNKTHGRIFLLQLVYLKENIFLESCQHCSAMIFNGQQNFTHLEKDT